MKFKLLFIFSTALFGCHAKGVDYLENKSDTVVVIFNKFPKYNNSIELLKGVTFRNPLPFILFTDNFHNTYYSPNSEINSDTIRVVPEGDYILLKHTFNIISSFDYLLKSGDTLILSYNQKIPYAEIPNRSLKKFDINYEAKWREVVKKNDLGYNHFEIYLNPFFSANPDNRIQDFLDKRKQVKDENFFLAKHDLINEIKYLDSLKLVNYISDVYYKFFKDKARHLLAKIDLEQSSIGQDSVDRIINVAPENVTYSYYYNFIESFVETVIEKKGAKIESSNGTILDYRKIFDQLTMSSIKQPYKTLLLYKYLKLIASNFSLHDMETYFAKFSQNTTDSFLLKDIISNYLLDYSKLEHAKDSVYLIDFNRKVYTLSDILKTNRGKVIFMDFWASWCIPCRRVMGDSKRLAHMLRNNKTAFIYLSIDRKFDDWKKAAEDDGTLSNSFLILNSNASEYLSELKVDEIPRYILYDKLGEIVSKNAPAPNTKELEILIRSLL